MVEARLRARLEQVERRHRLRGYWGFLSGCWLVVALAACLVTGWIPQLSWANYLVFTGITLVVTVGAATWRCWRQPYDLHAAAARVETAFPSLEQGLLTATHYLDSAHPARGFLEQQVLQAVDQHGHTHAWPQAVSGEAMARAAWIQGVALALMVFVLITRWPQAVPDANRLGAENSASASVFALLVEPGNVALERGTDLLVLARATEGVVLPDTVRLLVGAPDAPETIVMTKALDDAVWAARLPAVQHDCPYRVSHDQLVSSIYQVSVFDYPALERIDAQVRRPKYTGLANAAIRDTRHVAEVEGSTVTLECHLNKTVASALWVAEDGATIPLNRSSEGIYRAVVTPSQSKRYTLRLLDDAGRGNRFAETLTLDVLPNRRPEIKMTFPGRDSQVSCLEEITLQANMRDDFGIVQYGITFAPVGRSPIQVELGNPSANEPGQKQSTPGSQKDLGKNTRIETSPENRDRAMPERENVASWQAALESLNVKPGDLLTYHFWAEDFGTDGQPRRTAGNIYFAEVRHFDEVFRQGEAPAGGASMSGGSQPHDKLLEKQKQILSATWNLAHTEQSDDKRRDGARIIKESQEEALAEAQGLSKKTDSQQAVLAVVEAVAAMRQAVVHLNAVAANDAPTTAEPLPQAVLAEQAAYQALLKLKPREHRVTQSQGGGGGGSGSRQEDAQMQQLELQANTSRYETRRQASAENQTQAREQRQMHNRLKELARRQENIHQHLQELEAALRAAQTPQAQAEARRQLQRLRDEQQQMLRDLDDTRGRMAQANSRQNVAEAKQRLDQTRARAEQAARALAEGKVSQALSASERTQRDLRQLGEEFRKKSAHQFAEQMRDLRHDCRELDNTQQQVARALENANRGQRRSLRGDTTGPLADTMQRQQQRLQEVLQQASKVAEESETSEPLLHRALYEGVRQAAQQKLDQGMRMTGELLQRGMTAEAQQAERPVTTGVQNLSQTIERAAANILGDETESLRRARDEVQDLVRDLERELARTGNADKAGSHVQGKRGNHQDRSGKGDNSLADNGLRPASHREKAGNAASLRHTVLKPRQGQGQESDPSQDNSPKNNVGDGALAEAKGTEAPHDNSQPSQPDGPKGQNTAKGLASAGQTGAQPGTQPGEGASGSSAGAGKQPRPPGLRGASAKRGPVRKSPSASNTPGGSSGPGNGGEGDEGPVTGSSYGDWAERLRDVEELVEQPQLRERVAKAREQMRSTRAAFKRHSKEPNWDLVREQIARPLTEVRDRLNEELARRGDREAAVPLDRDPVPARYSAVVERYYERLGTGK